MASGLVHLGYSLADRRAGWKIDLLCTLMHTNKNLVNSIFMFALYPSPPFFHYTSVERNK